MRHSLAVLASLLLVAGCTGSSDIEVVTKAIRSGANVSAAIPGEFGGSAPSMGELYWVEGTVKNSGATEVRKVSISFRCTDGNNRRIFVAEVDRIPAGATVHFETDRYASPLKITLLEGEPEIKVGK
jgi:hypothetical protein